MPPLSPLFIILAHEREPTWEKARFAFWVLHQKRAKSYSRCQHELEYPKHCAQSEGQSTTIRKLFCDGRCQSYRMPILLPSFVGATVVLAHKKYRNDDGVRTGNGSSSPWPMLTLDLGLDRDQLETILKISIETQVLSWRCQVRNHSRPIHRGICT